MGCYYFFDFHYIEGDCCFAIFSILTNISKQFQQIKTQFLISINRNQMHMSLQKHQKVNRQASAHANQTQKRKTRQKKLENLEQSEDIKTKTINGGHWTKKQIGRYIQYVEANTKTLSQEKLRRNRKVFEKMSNRVMTRNPTQCRSHHQKVMNRFKSLEVALNYLKGKLESNRKQKRLLDQNYQNYEKQSEALSPTKQEALMEVQSQDFELNNKDICLNLNKQQINCSAQQHEQFNQRYDNLMDQWIQEASLDLFDLLI